MYSPFLVLPYHLSPGQWYTLELLLTHTCPGPPPAAATVGMGVAALFVGGVPGVGVGDIGAFAAAAGADAADDFVEALVLYQSFTPPCPAQAPRFDSADVYVPSLHSPVEPVGACAFAGNARVSTTATRDDAIAVFMVSPPCRTSSRGH